MNIKEGFKRIYIILSLLWFLFFAFIGFTDNDLILGLCFGIIPPVIVYCLIVWIVKGFENK